MWAVINWLHLQNSLTYLVQGSSSHQAKQHAQILVFQLYRRAGAVCKLELVTDDAVGRGTGPASNDYGWLMEPPCIARRMSWVRFPCETRKMLCLICTGSTQSRERE